MMMMRGDDRLRTKGGDEKNKVFFYEHTHSFLTHAVFCKTALL